MAFDAEPGDAEMSKPYVIKKYSSRRLYDVQSGAFITLEALDRVIRQGHTIHVVNAKGEDETRGILMQILMEREAAGEPLLSVDVLHEIVRMYGHAMQSPFGRYLEDGLAVMRKQREAWQNSLPESFRQATHGMVDTLVSQSMDWMRTTQSLWMGKQQKPAAEQHARDAPKRKRSRK